MGSSAKTGSDIELSGAGTSGELEVADASADAAPATDADPTTTEEEPAPDESSADAADESPAIPELSSDTPIHTPEGAVMIRPGTEIPVKAPVHTSVMDTMLRPPWGPFEDLARGVLLAELDAATDQAYYR